jgi:hypothetical protein
MSVSCQLLLGAAFGSVLVSMMASCSDESSSEQPAEQDGSARDSHDGSAGIGASDSGGKSDSGSDGGGHAGIGGGRAGAGGTGPGGAGGAAGAGRAGSSPDGGMGGNTGDADTAVDCTGPFSLEHQQPVECLPYPGSLWNKPLPADVLSHKAANSDEVVAATFTDNGKLTYPWTLEQGLVIVSTATSDGMDPPDPNAPLYYGQASDPVYKLEACPKARPASDPHCAVGKTFHAPSAAPFNYWGNDSALVVWDQTNNTIFNLYESRSYWVKLPQCPGDGGAGTDADPCRVSVDYCDQSNWSTDPGFYIYNGGDSLGNGGWATHDRGAEMIKGSIHHAQYLQTVCTNGFVFPSGGPTLACSDALDKTNKPPQGALLFFDYTTDQLAVIKNQVPGWQYVLLEAMTVYGGYIGETTGHHPFGVGIRNFEGPAAYQRAGLPYALGQWLLAFPHTPPATQTQPLACYDRDAGHECEFSIYMGIPLLTGPRCPDEPCDVSMHLHMADPCVAKGLAGRPDGCI